MQGLFNSAKSYVTGAPAGSTGSPADGSSCISCHSPHTNFSGSGLISSTIPVSGYTANQTYTVTASITRTGHSVFGFEVSPQDTTASGNLEGTIAITNSTTTQLASADYITHTQKGTNGTNNGISWSFNWTAPATGHGPVVFYGAFNASNGNGNDSGDSIFLTSLKVYECTAPVAPAAITGAASLCAGSSSTYTVPAGNPGTTFNWILPSGWSGSSTTNSITVTPAGNNGNISVLATNSCGTSSSVSKTVTVSSPVTAGISITASQNNICSGSQVTFSATTANGGSQPNYQWQLNGHSIGYDSSAYTSSGLTNGDVVTCVLTSNLACVTNNPVVSDSVTMTVNPIFIPAVTLSASALSLCADSSVTFRASATNGGTSPGYTWYKNGTVISGATGTNYTPSVFANNDVFSVQLTSNANCAQPASVTSNTDTLHVTSVVIPSAVISANPGNSICKGQSVVFSSTLTNAGNNASVQWQKNGVAISNATSNTYASDSLNNGDVITLRLTSSAACASPQTVLSGNITMQVNSVIPSVTISSNSGSSICSAQQVVFSASLSGGGNSPSCQWQANGVNIPGASGISYATDSLVDGEVISAILTSNAACASPRDTQSNSITISVVSNASPSVSILSSFGDSVCSGQTGLLTAIQLNGGNSPAYQWFDNNDTIAGATASTYTPATIGTTDTFTVQLVSNSTCVASNLALSAPFSATVLPTVTPTVSINLSGSDSICSGEELTITADAENAGANPKFQWLNNGVDINGQTNNTFSSTALTDSSQLSVMLTADLTCASPSTVLSSAILIRVAPPVQPTINLVSSAVGSILCPGQTVTFTSSETNGGLNPQYLWFKNDSLLANETDSFYIDTSINNNDAIAVQLISNAVCAAQDTVTSVADTITVATVFQSSVAIATNTDSVCPGSTVIFTAAIQSIGGSYGSPSFYWELNGSAAGENASQYIDTNVLNGDVISCHCSSASACQSTITSNNITMTVFATATPLISSQGDSLLASAGINYLWFDNGQQIAGAINQVLPTDSEGVYSVQVTDSNGCQSLSDTFHFIPAGLADLKSNLQFNIYPNPGEGILYMHLINNASDEELRVTVYNMSGEIMSRQFLSVSGGQSKFRLDLSDLSNGVYVIQVSGSRVNAWSKYIMNK